MIRFVHTADIHFGMENYGKIDSATGIHTRLLDFERALNFCIDHAIDQHVDFFLFAGDAYKTAHPSPTQQRLFLQCLLRLHNAKIPVVIVVGNHDTAVSFGKAHALDLFGQLPVDGFHVMAKPAILTLQTKSGPCTIVGIPWPSRSTLALNNEQYASAAELTTAIAEKITSIIATFAQKIDPCVPAVLAGHLTVSSGIFSGSEKRAVYGTDPLFLPSELAIPPYDYVALGHLHRFQNLGAAGTTPVIYAGSLERIDFGERNEEKSFCIVTIKNKNDVSYEVIKTPTRPFIQFDIHLHPNQSPTEQIIAAVKQKDIKDAVIKIVYIIPTGMKESINTAAIQSVCTSAHYLVGIIPVRLLETKQRRAAVTTTMDMPTLLSNYLEQKPELFKQKEALLAKAVSLQAELKEQEELTGQA